MSNAKYKDIHERIFTFALAILSITKEVSQTPENIILIKQFVRSATSIGANAREADGAESKKEFIHKFTIAKKEAKETHYWLRLLLGHNPHLKSKLEILIDENMQLIAIINKIIINAKSSVSNAK